MTVQFLAPKDFHHGLLLDARKEANAQPQNRMAVPTSPSGTKPGLSRLQVVATPGVGYVPRYFQIGPP